MLVDYDGGPKPPEQRNIELLIEYSGGHFAGWQVQPNARTAMGEIERAIAEITREDIRVVAASRTDAGVHALGQVASFKSTTRLTTRRLLAGLNAVLPDDIAVSRVRDVPSDFHARYSASGKHYRYGILNRPTRSPLEATAWHVPERLDVPAMAEAAKYLEGEHDFSALAAKADDDSSCVRHLHRVRVSRARGPFGAEDLVVVDVIGDAFLYKMVRTIVGTLVYVGRGKHAPQWVASMLRTGKRERAGPTAPAEGLVLVKVFYAEDGLTEPMVEQYLDGRRRESHDYRPQHAGSRQREGVRRAEGPEARALLGRAARG